jgi:5-deoxy-glucuronate isomerase
MQLFRNTASKKGRTLWITPDNSDFKFISYARILVDDTTGPVTARNVGSETTLLCLHGSGKVRVGADVFPISRFDGVYVERGAEFTVESDSTIDVVEASCPTEKQHPTRYVNFQHEVKNDPNLALGIGAEPYYRDIYKVIAENVEGSRILMGVTMSKPGNWTSWPPHEHAATREELYLFFDIPHPGFATQFIYTDLAAPEFAEPVFDNDAVTIVKGYHPNVAAPGYPVNFCWVLCSLEDDTWRTLANVNVQPGFETMPTGLR